MRALNELHLLMPHTKIVAFTAIKPSKKCHTHDPNRFFLLTKFGLCLAWGGIRQLGADKPSIRRGYLHCHYVTSFKVLTTLPWIRRPFTRQFSMTGFMHVPLLKLEANVFLSSLCFQCLFVLLLFKTSLPRRSCEIFFVWISKAARSWIVLGGFLFDTWQNWFARSHFFLLMIHE